jgi:tRNA(Ile)-lysidine synthase
MLRNEHMGEGNLGTPLFGRVLAACRSALADAGLLGSRILVAVSGGVDSVCLLHLLTHLGRATDGHVRSVHVDHGLRADSGMDAGFCRRLADELGVPFHLVELEASELRGSGVQARARDLRRGALGSLRERLACDAVALGHHRDDQAETVLFRLLRGTGARGASGMRCWESPYLRPLLDVPKEDLRALAVERGWAFREDPSNATMGFTRNRLRHQVLPVLRSLNPRAGDALVRFARRMAEDDELLSELARRELACCSRREPEGLRLDARRLLELSPALRRRLYLAAWAEVGCDPSCLEARHLETVDELLKPGKLHRQASTPGPGSFARSRGDLWILGPGAFEVAPVDARLPGPGRKEMGSSGEFVWSETATDAPLSGAVCVPPYRPRGELVVRTWKPGDRLENSRKIKVKDILMEGRLPPWRRARALVVGDEEGLFGVLAPGFAWPERGEDSGGAWVEGGCFPAGTGE